MAMPASATFSYRVEVRSQNQAGARVWIGRATTLFPADHHPGLVASAPDFELSNGIVSLRLSRPSGRLLRLFAGDGPARAVSFRIGPVLDELLETGDVILLDRDHMAALSLCLLRGRDLILGLGALTCRPLPGDDDVRIDEDPRTERRQDYWLAHQVRERQAHIVWIDPQVEPIELSVRRVEHLTEGRPLVVAYRNVEQQTFRRYFEQYDCIHRFGSTSYARHPRFDNVDEWRTYLMGLPDHPPTDLQLHARCGTQQVHLAKGDEAELGPFIVRAEQVNLAIEWHRSMAAVIRQSPAADRVAFREASASLTSDALRIDGRTLLNRTE
jgi:hypothetical protein